MLSHFHQPNCKGDVFNLAKRLEKKSV